MKIISKNRINVMPRRRAFTLVELLVVISIIGVLAAMILPLAGSVARTKKINTAQAEMQQIETGLENYKATYGVYPPSNPTNAILNTLFFELSGATNYNGTYTTLDSLAYAASGDYTGEFNVGGIVNCSSGISSEDAANTKFAKDFLPGLKAAQVVLATNSAYSASKFGFLVTSVGGPDLNYQPLGTVPGNPFRYAYPGTNNPNGYDLWVQLSINSGFSAVNVFTSTNLYLICNWNQQVQHNNPAR
jgi:prepilin-type N-terminal cleavage/methylation domain-containing protein